MGLTNTIPARKSDRLAWNLVSTAEWTMGGCPASGCRHNGPSGFNVGIVKTNTGCRILTEEKEGDDNTAWSSIYGKQ